MKRREFLRYGSMGAAGLTLGGSNLSWMIKEAQAADTPLKFGVMSDTQWSNNADGLNPGTCAVGIITELNQQFIAHGCKFVVQVGDLVNNESTSGVRNLPVRAEAAQPLYDAGVDFLCCRGNHESSSTAAAEIPVLFPHQLGEGDGYNFSVENYVQSDKDNLHALSYAFDVGNVRIVMLDQFNRVGGGSEIHDQLDWVDSVLENRGSDTHAFVMAHKNLSGQNHKDCVLGGSATANPDSRNQFITSMDRNKVGYYLGGHDHQHFRSVVASPDGNGAAEQIITSSNSYKFYTPRGTTAPGELSVAHELYTVGYYIFTVDGPCVTVDFYSTDKGANYGSSSVSYTPPMDNFYLRETFGYSLNGKSFNVAHGEYYDVVEDTFEGTTAKILAGQNGNTETDYLNNELVKTVKTGWKPMPSDAASCVLKLWGMMDNLSMYQATAAVLPNADEPTTSEPYALSMSYDASRVSLRALRRGAFGIKAQDAEGNWVDAVDLNAAGSKQFVYGPYNNHGLGAYGVDPRTGTVWAVVDHDGTFVAK